ncbi:hypothetical protein FTUN_2563 [Frigoriglobus tundricola]|uniref:Uncharacterized protein n=1 Tax=Frigoriglobus tundricola TaxID=2774151 RepID=A0A6M5YLX5_9BACT|nr:hypothetical protein FTUN_2563 [Frigoriglobus tundricola]
MKYELRTHDSLFFTTAEGQVIPALVNTVEVQSTDIIELLP